MGLSKIENTMLRRVALVASTPVLAFCVFALLAGCFVALLVSGVIGAFKEAFAFVFVEHGRDFVAIFRKAAAQWAERPRPN